MICNGFLSPSERGELESCTRSHREDHGIARRANAILLLDDGKALRFAAFTDIIDTILGLGLYAAFFQGAAPGGRDARRLDWSLDRALITLELRPNTGGEVTGSQGTLQIEINNLSVPFLAGATCIDERVVDLSACSSGAHLAFRALHEVLDVPRARADMDGRLAVDALRFKRPPINPHVMTSPLKGTIGVLFPFQAHPLDGLGFQTCGLALACDLCGPVTV